MLRHSIALILHTWIKARESTYPLPDGMSLFYNTMPPAPDNCLVIHESEGIINGKSHKTRKIYETYGIKARSRASGELAADRARYFIFWLDSHLQGAQFKGSVVSLDGFTYTLHAAHQYGSITSLGLPDKTKQAAYTQDYHISIRG